MRTSKSPVLGATLALAAAVAATAPARAADLEVPSPVAGGCPVPAVQAEPRDPPPELVDIFLKQRDTWVQPPRVVTVEPFEGTIPGPPKYVKAQTAWLASSECPPVLGWSEGGSWYDGKTFYYEGTTPQRPDEFMIVVEPSVVHEPIIKRLLDWNEHHAVTTTGSVPKSFEPEQD